MNMINYPNMFGETSTLIIYELGKDFAKTDVGTWHFQECLGCFLRGKKLSLTRCVGGCIHDDISFQYKVSA